MKNLKTIVLAGFLLVGVTACQKDYYLEDLNDALAEIEILERENETLEMENETLESKITQLQNQIDHIQRDNYELQQRLNQIQDDYNDAIVSLEEANEMIDKLESDIVNIEILSGQRQLEPQWFRKNSVYAWWNGEQWTKTMFKHPLENCYPNYSTFEDNGHSFFANADDVERGFGLPKILEIKDSYIKFSDPHGDDGDFDIFYYAKDFEGESLLCWNSNPAPDGWYTQIDHRRNSDFNFVDGYNPLFYAVFVEDGYVTRSHYLNKDTGCIDLYSYQNDENVGRSVAYPIYVNGEYINQSNAGVSVFEKTEAPCIDSFILPKYLPVGSNSGSSSSSNVDLNSNDGWWSDLNGGYITKIVNGIRVEVHVINKNPDQFNKCKVAVVTDHRVNNYPVQVKLSGLNNTPWETLLPLCD